MNCYLSDWESRPDDFKSLLHESSNWNDVSSIVHFTTLGHHKFGLH